MISQNLLNREPGTVFRIRVAHDLAEFAKPWPRTDCYGSAHCYVFQCADHLEVWCETIGKARGTRTFFVGVFDQIGSPVLLLPLGIERRLGIRVLCFLDGGVCDYNAPIVFKSARVWRGDAVQRLWQELLRVLPPFDIAIFDKMPADIGGVPNPLIALGGTPLASGHLIKLAGSWQEYVTKQLPYRRKSGQQRRKMARLGRVAFTIAETPTDRQRVVETMMRQKSRRCLETGQPDESGRPGYRQYYLSITERFTWPGPLLVTALELDDKILATSWSFVFDRRFLWLVTTFEGGDWKGFSTGRILLEDLLKWSFANGITTFDFGSGDESYKLKYSNETAALYQVVMPVTVVGKAYQVGRKTKASKFINDGARRIAANIAKLPELLRKP
jgi:CelD/BcsL family acetyltransferase involved in cellulose biosynthesis